MQSVRRRALRILLVRSSSSLSSSCISTLARRSSEPPTRSAANGPLPRAPLATPWAAVQTRGCKVHGSDVRTGNIIEKNGRFYQVLKAQHTQQGRGGATIQVELRDVDSGNKSNSRFRTDETIEKVFVEQKSFTFLYQEGDTVVLMEPNTFEQVEVSRELFGNAAVYLKEDVPVTLHIYDEKVMSASIPPKVTCTVVDAQPTTKGLTAAPQYKKVVLDNGLTVSGEVGDGFFCNASDSSSIAADSFTDTDDLAFHRNEGSFAGALILCKENELIIIFVIFESTCQEIKHSDNSKGACFTVSEVGSDQCPR